MGKRSVAFGRALAKSSGHHAGGGQRQRRRTVNVLSSCPNTPTKRTPKHHRTGTRRSNAATDS